MGERHTDTQYARTQVQNTATQVLVPANRKRKLHLTIGTLAPPVWVGEDRSLTPATGNLVSRWAGSHYELGPGQFLYAVTVGPFGAVLNTKLIDRQDEGLFTDDGSGVEGTLSGGGNAEEVSSTPAPAGIDRAARS